MVLATFYALGHAAVVFVLGVVAIVLVGRGAATGSTMRWAAVVGITLLALGIYVVVSLARQRPRLPDAQPVDAGLRVRPATRPPRGAAAPPLRRGRRHARPRPSATTSCTTTTRHDHDHWHGVTVRAGAAVRTQTAHHHVHHHVGTLPADPFPTYGRPTAIAVGALHGIGAETPTQILLFLAAARAGGTAVGDRAAAAASSSACSRPTPRRADRHVRVPASLTELRASTRRCR